MASKGKKTGPGCLTILALVLIGVVVFAMIRTHSSPVAFGWALTLGWVVLAVLGLIVVVKIVFWLVDKLIDRGP